MFSLQLEELQRAARNALPEIIIEFQLLTLLRGDEVCDELFDASCGLVHCSEVRPWDYPVVFVYQNKTQARIIQLSRFLSGQKGTVYCKVYLCLECHQKAEGPAHVYW